MEVADRIDDLLVLSRVTYSTDNVTSNILTQAIEGHDPRGRIPGVGLMSR
ncbi:hypothetical protein IC582_013706 [Cucumis melo]